MIKRNILYFTLFLYKISILNILLRVFFLTGYEVRCFFLSNFSILHFVIFVLIFLGYIAFKILLKKKKKIFQITLYLQTKGYGWFHKGTPYFLWVPPPRNMFGFVFYSQFSKTRTINEGLRTINRLVQQK